LTLCLLRKFFSNCTKAKLQYLSEKNFLLAYHEHIPHYGTDIITFSKKSMVLPDYWLWIVVLKNESRNIDVDLHPLTLRSTSENGYLRFKEPIELTEL